MPSAATADALTAAAVTKRFGGLVAVENMSFALAEKANYQIQWNHGQPVDGKPLRQYVELKNGSENRSPEFERRRLVPCSKSAGSRGRSAVWSWMELAKWRGARAHMWAGPVGLARPSF